MRNKRGLMNVEIAYLATAFLITTYTMLPGTRKEFQYQKAVGMCEENYRGVNVPDCIDFVNTMTKKEILAYIKDDIAVPQYPMAERLGG
jgi:hypothetical protein